MVGCLTSQQHASVSQGRICSNNFTCYHTEIKVADPTFYLTRSQYTDTGPTSPSADPITPGAWQGSHRSASFEVTGMTRPRKNPGASGIRTRESSLPRRTPKPLGQRGGRAEEDKMNVPGTDRCQGQAVRCQCLRADKGATGWTTASNRDKQAYTERGFYGKSVDDKRPVLAGLCCRDGARRLGVGVLCLWVGGEGC